MSLVILLLLLSYACVSDVLTHRIPNWLCLGGLLAGVLIQCTSAGFPGAAPLVASIVVPFCLFIPFYIGGGMAAGDVKLMVACGALLGWPSALLATGSTLVVGTVFGVCVFLHRAGMSAFASRYLVAMRVFCLTGAVFLDRADPTSVAASRFPYAFAIAGGCVVSQWYLGWPL